MACVDTLLVVGPCGTLEIAGKGEEWAVKITTVAFHQLIILTNCVEVTVDTKQMLIFSTLS